MPRLAGPAHRQPEHQPRHPRVERRRESLCLRVCIGPPIWRRRPGPVTRTGCIAWTHRYGRLALVGYQSIANDDLACGVWPDNEPAVTGLDWQSGQPNAKFWVVQLLAKALGAGPKALLNVTLRWAAPPAPPPPAGTVAAGYCDATSGAPSDCNSDAKGSWSTKGWANETLAACVAKARFRHTRRRFDPHDGHTAHGPAVCATGHGHSAKKLSHHTCPPQARGCKNANFVSFDRGFEDWCASA